MEMNSFFFFFFLFFFFFSLICGTSSRDDQTLTAPLPPIVGFHKAQYDSEGTLLPWQPYEKVLEMEMNWYQKAPIERGNYPIWIYNTFMDGNYSSTGESIIPATQDGLGIISYLKYYEFTNKTRKDILQTAILMGDYIVNETLTFDFGYWPSFTRSSGLNLFMPLETAAQGDLLYGTQTIEPDKGGIAGYALYLLYNYTKYDRYLQQALQNARVLVNNMREGTASIAPWAFRVNSIDGEEYGNKNGNMIFIVRLFDVLISEGYKEFIDARNTLWNWILNFQIPSKDDPNSSMWVGFFEDIVEWEEVDRNSWCPLETARYLIEKKQSVDNNWMKNVEKLIHFSLNYFSGTRPGNVTVMGEQDKDHKPWGGACSKLAAIGSMFSCAGGSKYYDQIATSTLNWMTYFIDNDGCPAAKNDGISDSSSRGGWQEDAHTDKIHNWIDALNAKKGIC